MNNKEIFIRLYQEYAKKYVNKILFSLFFSLLVAGSTAFIAWLLDPAIKKIFIERDQTLLYLIPLAIIIAFITKGSSLYLARKIMIIVSTEVTKDIQVDMAKSIIHYDTQYLESKHSGKFVSNLTYDISLITNMVSTGILNLMKDSFTLIGLLTVMFYQNWKLSLMAILMIPLATIASKSLGKRMSKVTTQAQEKSGILLSYLSELFKNYKLIKIYQKEKFELERADKFINSFKNTVQKIQIVFTRSTPIMETLTGIMIAALIYYSAILVRQGTLEINNFFSFLAAMMLAYQPVRSLATLNISLQSGLSAAKRVLPVIDQKNKINENLNFPEIKIKNAEINFKDVSFNYLENDNVLNSINLKIKGGEVAALVGHSGAGKSTIINLIPRFYDTKNGDILIDNQSIYKVSLSSLRSKISFVSQDIYLFDDTIKSNLYYAKSDASESELIESCKFANADEFIDKLPLKYDTIIGENGLRLSGGQKQRLSIARAILKNSPIILLDEATSSLDADTEFKIQNAIMNLVKNRTTIIIAHRLSTIFKADTIFVIENGEVAAQGQHKDLLEKSKIYQNFYNKQLDNSN